MGFPRFFYNSDASFLHFIHPPITLDRFVREAVGWLASTQVDGVICEMFTYGNPTPLYPTDIPEARRVMPEKLESVNIWKSEHNLRAMSQMAEDPWSAAIKAAHQHGMPFWASMRFNDSHPTTHGARSAFSIAHPEYVLGDKCGAAFHPPNPDGSISDCFHDDFSIAEIRKYRLDLIEELCARYDIDGFQYDHMRDLGHNFPKGITQEQGREILTEYMQETKELLVHLGEKRNRPIGFATRIPGTPEMCWEYGIDAPRWVEDDIFDMITPSVYYDTTTELTYDEFVKLAEGKPCKIYACPTEGVGPGRFRPPPVEAVRGATLEAWRQGVDGINLFNFCLFIQDDQIDSVCLLNEMGDPASLERKNKLYMVAGIALACQSRFFGRPCWTAYRHQLPVEIPVQPDGPGVIVHFNVGDDIESAKADRVLSSLILRLDFNHFSGEEDMELELNGLAIPMNTVHSTRSSQYAFNWPYQHGHLELSFDLTHGDWVHQGRNEFSIILHSRPKEIGVSLALYALRLEVNYRLFPMDVSKVIIIDTMEEMVN